MFKNLLLTAIVLFASLGCETNIKDDNAIDITEIQESPQFKRVLTNLEAYGKPHLDKIESLSDEEFKSHMNYLNEKLKQFDILDDELLIAIGYRDRVDFLGRVKKLNGSFVTLTEEFPQIMELDETQKEEILITALVPFLFEGKKAKFSSDCEGDFDECTGINTAGYLVAAAGCTGVLFTPLSLLSLPCIMAASEIYKSQIGLCVTAHSNCLLLESGN